MKPPIYTPQGKARPYASLALNPYLTCSFRCPFCYNAVRIGESFFSDYGQERPGFRAALAAQLAARKRGRAHLVHMSFLGDVYQPAEIKLELTRFCIKALHANGFYVQLLTKAPALPERDFPLLGPGDKFGITLTSGATTDTNRLALLVEAQKQGIRIWLSLEPVLSLAHAQEALAAVASYELHPDPLWIGPLHHHPRDYDWQEVRTQLAKDAAFLGLKVCFKE